MAIIRFPSVPPEVEHVVGVVASAVLVRLKAEHQHCTTRGSATSHSLGHAVRENPPRREAKPGLRQRRLGTQGNHLFGPW